MLVGVLAGFVGVRGELHAAGLAAPADLDLRLDDDRVAERIGHLHGVVDGVGDVAGRDGDAVAGEELLALVLEQVHLGEILRGQVAVEVAPCARVERARRASR